MTIGCLLYPTDNAQNPAYSPAPFFYIMNIWAVVLAAGQSSRLSKGGIESKKQFLEYKGCPLFWNSVITFARSSVIDGIIITFPKSEFSKCAKLVQKLIQNRNPGIPVKYCQGGELRQDSVYNALMQLPDECDYVMVHDAARPFFKAALVHSLAKKMDPGDGGVIPVIPCADTVKKLRDGQVLETLSRDELALVQTPQFFPKNILINSHKIAGEENFMVTDDASMVEKSGFTVKTVPGHESNAKITTVEDLKMIKEPADTALPCTGFGYDVHRYGGPRAMVLGGIPISGAPGVYAHSDGDVLLHALVDAVLGCLGKGDIGDIFPDTDSRFESMSSTVFLSEALLLAQKEGLRITHVDITIVAQIPKISPFKNQIKSSIEALMGLQAAQVNIKATTEEKLGFTGSKQGIKAMAVVSALRNI